MKNVLAYYYELHPDEISYRDKKYFFSYHASKYVFEEYNRPLSDIESLYKINKEMISRRLLVHEIIINKENKILTNVNGTFYILMEIFVNTSLFISLNDLIYINNNSIGINFDNKLERYDWVSLWETKNDYFEAQINEVGRRFPHISIYINYYIGLAENAIFYVREANKINVPVLKCVCHKRININDSLYELYHPMKYIFDYRVRDVSEYVKSAFFKEKDAKKLVEEYFNNNYVSYKEALLFYGRLLYPSYFFDLYDDILNGNLEEKIVEEVINKTDLYEKFLLDTYKFLSGLYNEYFPSIDWIVKGSV